MKLRLTNLIINNERYKQLVSQLETLENGRIFCGHDMEHFLSVARIAVILCEENDIKADRDIIYSAALLHDIGRTEEYINGTPHDKASAEIADKILDEIECPEEKKMEIIDLILSHRCPDGEKSALAKVFYTADKRSRMCFCCKAQNECNWPEYKKNNKIGV
ncbi:MAG: HD domain-containing protein [Ruminococcus sp.]|nr:HD domain-containing protein [Ruminococcus sp.]